MSFDFETRRRQTSDSPALAAALREINAEVTEDRAAVECPAAEAIKQRNLPPQRLGAAATFEYLGSREMYMRKAAEAIIYMRRNRQALKRMGRNWRAADALWLGVARKCRLRAQEVALGLRPLPVQHNKTAVADPMTHIRTVNGAMEAIFGDAA